MKKLLELLDRPGARLGAFVDAGVFGVMCVVWEMTQASAPGARNADAGSMSLLIPVMFLFMLLVYAVLAACSALLGAFAGYWAVRSCSPWLGLLAGILVGMVGAGLLGLVFQPGAGKANLVDAWIPILQWLVPPPAVAGWVVGFVEVRRGKQV